MMSTPGWSAADDDALMEDLKHAVSEVDMADDMLVAARAAFTWRTVDAELLALTHDSSLDSAAAVRGAMSDNRILAFSGHDFTVELEVVADALVGQLLPGRECRVVLTSPGGRVSEDSVSPDGFFLVPHQGLGPVRLEFQAADFRLATDWISL